MIGANLRSILAATAASAVLLAAMPWLLPDFWLSLALTCLMYAALAVSWAMFCGATNYLSLATSAFFGLGAYVTAWGLTTLSYPVAVILGGLVAAAFAVLVGAAVLHLRGAYFAVLTFGLGELVRHAIRLTPQMPLMLQENFTVKLLDMLRTSELDCAIMAEPFPDSGLAIAPLYDEPFMVAVPKSHALAKRKSVSAEELKRETMLLLGTGHCFRDHVLEVCPEYARFSSDAEGIRKSFEGSSLETIKYMVASGMGVTVVPQLSVPKDVQPHVRYVKFAAPVPTRRVVLAWRRRKKSRE